MNLFETSGNIDMDDNRCIFTCTYNCEKNIYDTPRIEQILKSDMLNDYFNHTASFTSAFSVRELELEKLISSHKLDAKKSLSIGINESDKKKILEQISSYRLSPIVEDFAEQYNHLFGKRNGFLWKWLGVVYKDSGVMLSTVDPRYIDSITDTKILFTMLFSVLDDVSEYYKDEKLMNDLLEIVSNKSSKNTDKKNDKVIFFKKLWNHFSKEIKKLPRYKEFKDIIPYDLNQIVNSVRFSYMTNQKPECLNLKEVEFYGSFNMIVYVLNGIDLMASPKFDKKELPHLRTVFWNAQQMARIGNWLSTWKREIKEEDISSGVFAYALSHNILSVDELKKIKSLDEKYIIEKIENSGMFEYFQGNWKESYENIKNKKDSIKSVDINRYMNGLENLIKLHLASEGYK
jgi:hypothetical protein